jgi:hypothetical protein
MPSLMLAPGQSDIQTALRAFLIAILPEGVEVIEGEDNNVGEPASTDFVAMTVMRRPRLGTNVDTLDPEAGTSTAKQPTEIAVQLDVHSADLATASDNAQLISTMFRDEFATSFFEQFPGITPLYAEDPRQSPFINAQQQYEPRYIIDALLQADQAVTTTVQTANTLQVGLFRVP